MATTMKAINISGIGGLDVLVSSTVPVPTPGPEDVLINVKAVSINPVEAKIRAGKWAGGTMPAGSILGFDAAGVIAGVGSSVGSAFKAGDEVYFLGSTLPTKSNAEYALVDYRAVALKPKTASFEDAAGLPLVGLTAWELVVEQLKVGQDDESEGGAVLIVNGAGGVGSVASQLVRNVSGVSTVITTASRSESIAHTKSLGATHTISHRPEAGSLKSQIDKLGLNVPVKWILVFTTTTKDLLDQCIEAVAPRGKIGLAVQGPPGSYDGFGAAQRKGVSFSWGFVFTRMALKFNLETQGKALASMAKLVDEGKLKSITTKSLPLTVSGLREAHQLMESGTTMGKVVLKVPETGAFE